MDISSCLNNTVQLLRNIVNGDVSDFVMHEAELKDLWCFSEMHNISNLLYLPLRNVPAVRESETFTLFEQAYYKNIVFSTQQHQYLEQIVGAFEAEGIKYMTMKGSVLKYLYPDVSLRTSCDIDIYIGDSDAEKAKNIMLNLGFEVGMYGNVDKVPDTYHMDNRFHVELHRELMHNGSDFKWKDVCNDIENSLEQGADKRYECKMSDEDFYIFMIIHIAKHIKFGGIGIRAFFDVWLFLEKFRNELDWGKIEERLKKADLIEFNKNVLLLIDVWSGKTESAPAYIDEFQRYIANGGVWGTVNEMKSERLYNQGKNKGKLSYYCSVVFLPITYMKEKYPILKKLPVLLPFCWIHRGIYTLFFKYKSFRSVIHHFDKADINRGKETADLKKLLGL